MFLFTAIAAGASACAFGGPEFGQDGNGIFSEESYDYAYNPSDYESAQGTLFVVESEDDLGHLVGSVGSVNTLDHTATADVSGSGASARVTLTVADQAGTADAMTIFYINGDLRQIVELGEVTFTGRTASEGEVPLTTGVTGCWDPGWSSESTTANVEVVAVADEESETIDITFIANFRGGDGEVVGHTVLTYAEVPAGEVYNDWW
ncbi:MAG: hypothetical protein ACJAYU_004671 [Bradymonadia bacterium]|jgi:hypothetical protein